MDVQAVLDAATANECSACGQPLTWLEPDEEFVERGYCLNPHCLLYDRVEIAHDRLRETYTAYDENGKELT